MRVEQFGQPSVSPSRRPLGVAALMLLLAVPVAASAQAASSGVMADDRAGRACLDTLSDANLTRVTVSQRAILMETNPAVLAQAALISQRIAATARAALGGVGDSLPAANALGVWRQAIEHLPLVIALHRDGPFSWHRDRGDGSATAKLVAFYERVLRSIPADCSGSSGLTATRPTRSPCASTF